jgi:histidinol-phosphate aminotransferase
VAVHRLGPAEGWAVDPPATRAAAAGAALVWLCSPNNPTALPEPDGLIETLLAGITADAAAAGRDAPVVVLDEAYAEFVGRSLEGLRSRYPNLIVIRTISKAYALAGLRVGFALADPAVIDRLNPYRPPGSVSIISVTVATAVLRDDEALATNLGWVASERARLTAALRGAGWSVGDSVTNFLLVDFGTPERSAAAAERLLRRGLVPRTFPAGHPLAHALRLTVRAPDENDRLIAAAGDPATETDA